MRTLITLMAAGAVAGCAQVPQMTAVDLAGRAERNMIEAQQNLGGRAVIVRGVVKATTMVPRERITVAGAGWGWAAATATRSDEPVPLVVLQPGSVHCYFEPNRIGDASALREGEAAAFECEVHHFQSVNQVAVSVLASCRSAK